MIHVFSLCTFLFLIMSSIYLVIITIIIIIELLIIELAVTLLLEKEPNLRISKNDLK